MENLFKRNENKSIPIFNIGDYVESINKKNNSPWNGILIIDSIFDELVIYDHITTEEISEIIYNVKIKDGDGTIRTALETSLKKV